MIVYSDVRARTYHTLTIQSTVRITYSSRLMLRFVDMYMQLNTHDHTLTAEQLLYNRTVTHTHPVHMLYITYSCCRTHAPRHIVRPCTQHTITIYSTVHVACSSWLLSSLSIYTYHPILLITHRLLNKYTPCIQSRVLVLCVCCTSHIPIAVYMHLDVDIHLHNLYVS